MCEPEHDLEIIAAAFLLLGFVVIVVLIGVGAALWKGML